MSLDVLAIAAHPDDVEQTCGGTLIRMAEAGYRTGVLDLTAGDMGTRGTPEERVAESEAAAKHMRLAWRGNLRLPDARLENIVGGAHDAGHEDPRTAAAGGDSALLAGAASGSLPLRRDGLRGLLPGGAEETRSNTASRTGRRRSCIRAFTRT